MKTVLILCGGKSEEHEISLISAKGILAALDRKKYKPLIVGISKQGIWYLEEESSFFIGQFQADQIALNEKAPTVTFVPFSNDKKQGTLLSENRSYIFDIVFPILHGRLYENAFSPSITDVNIEINNSLDLLNY